MSEGETCFGLSLHLRRWKGSLEKDGLEVDTGMAADWGNM